MDKEQEIKKMFEEKQRSIEKRGNEKDTGQMVGNAITNAVNWLIAKNCEEKDFSKKLYEIAKSIIEVSIQLKSEYLANKDDTEQPL